MTASTVENPALRRMLRPAKPATSGVALTEARAWRVSIPRVSERNVRLVASVAGFETGTTDLEEILMGWGDFALSLTLEGAEEARGLAQLDEALVAALVEVQTVGLVSNSQIPERTSTALDAALCDHVVAAWLGGAAEVLDDEELPAWQVGAHVPDPRAAKVSIDDGNYRATEVTISLGDGARTGMLRLLYPQADLPGKDGAPVAAMGRRSAMLTVPAELEAVLHRTAVPLSWLRTLAPDAILEIPRGAIDRVRIETVDGKRLARARLGRMGGHRAIRLQDEDPGEGAYALSAVPLDGFASSPHGAKEALHTDADPEMPEHVTGQEKIGNDSTPEVQPRDGQDPQKLAQPGTDALPHL